MPESFCECARVKCAQHDNTTGQFNRNVFSLDGKREESAKYLPYPDQP